MNSTLTKEQQQSIADFLKGRHISAGLGWDDEPCSIAAINLALTGKLTDEIPDCMSEVIGRWIIGVQDPMPDEMRNSDEWRSLLPLAAGTGLDREAERLELIMDWMWETVLPTFQPVADKHGFGQEWRRMCDERSAAAARAVWAAGEARAENAAHASAWTAKDFEESQEAAWTANMAAAAAHKASWASWAAGASWASWAANRAAAVARPAAEVATWHQFDPCGLLERLIKA